MSAFEGKADMTVCGSPLSRSLLGVKRTCLCALHMSAYDPKQTSAVPRSGPSRVLVRIATVACPSLGGSNEKAGVHHASRRCGGHLAARGTIATSRKTLEGGIYCWRIAPGIN